MMQAHVERLVDRRDEDSGCLRYGRNIEVGSKNNQRAARVGEQAGFTLFASLIVRGHFAQLS
jgi:hypothetical protein